MNQNYVKDGIIDLDYLVNNNKLKPNNFNSSSKMFIFKNSNNEQYYFKYENSWIMELLCEKIAEHLQIPHVHYEVSTFENIHGVISKDLKKDNFSYINGKELIHSYLNSLSEKELNEYYNGQSKEKLLKSSNNLELIWHALEYRYNDYPNKDEIINKLMNSLLDLFEFSIITCGNDKNETNYMIEESSSSISLAPLFDNGLSFTKYPVYLLHLSEESYRSNETDIAFKTYLKMCDNERINDFISKYNGLKIEDIRNYLDEIFNNIKDPTFINECIKNFYKFHMFEAENRNTSIETLKSDIIKLFLYNKKNIMKLIKEYNETKGSINL